MPTEERLRRVGLKRIDPQTEAVYNLEENPPPVDVKPRVLPSTDPLDTQESVMKEVGEISLWSSKFGSEAVA